MMIGVILPMLFVDWYNTSTHLIITRNLNGGVNFRMNRCCLRGCKPLDIGHITFPIIFNLHSGQQVTPLFMGYGTIVLMFTLQLILHGFRESVISGNVNNTFIKLFVADGTI